jgi:hypothetical protein
MSGFFSPGLLRGRQRTAELGDLSRRGIVLTLLKAKLAGQTRRRFQKVRHGAVLAGALNA